MLSPRSKEERLKRQDSKDDIRGLWKSSRKDGKEESRGSAGKEDCKYGIRLFRRDNSREDVARESGNSNANSAALAGKGKQAGKEEKPEERVGVWSSSKSKWTVQEQGRTRSQGREGSKESLDGGKWSRNEEEGPRVNQNERVKAQNQQTMLDVVLTDEKPLLEEQQAARKADKQSNKEEDQMVQQAEALENDKNADSMKETAECLIDSSETDVTAFGPYERKDIGHGKKLDDFQVVSSVSPC